MRNLVGARLLAPLLLAALVATPVSADVTRAPADVGLIAAAEASAVPATDAEQYAARERAAPQAADFEGGGRSTVIISGGTVTVVLLIVLLVILL